MGICLRTGATIYLPEWEKYGRGDIHIVRGANVFVFVLNKAYIHKSDGLSTLLPSADCEVTVGNQGFYSDRWDRWDTLVTPWCNVKIFEPLRPYIEEYPDLKRHMTIAGGDDITKGFRLFPGSI